MEDDAHRPIELVELGDVMEETKQCTPWGVLYDSWFGLGSHEYQHGLPPQC